MINPTEVHEIMKDCLFRDSELVGGKPADGVEFVMVKGIVHNFGLHLERISKHKKRIGEMLCELPLQFRAKSEGGKDGWTFLNACNDKDGKLWGQHPDIEALVCLGIATEQAAFCMPRKMWAAMPGGVPYFVVKVPNEPADAPA